LKLELMVTTHAQQAEQDRTYWLQQTREARLEMVETLRMEAGRFLYDYPARLRRVITVTRKVDKADAEELSAVADGAAESVLDGGI